MARFTIAQHRKLGQKIKKLETDISEAIDLVSDPYPVRISDKLRYCSVLIERFRSMMDNELFSEYPEIESAELLKIYYGNGG